MCIIYYNYFEYTSFPCKWSYKMLRYVMLCSVDTIILRLDFLIYLFQYTCVRIQGTDTLGSATASCLLALAQYPDIQVWTRLGYKLTHFSAICLGV